MTSIELVLTPLSWRAISFSISAVFVLSLEILVCNSLLFMRAMHKSFTRSASNAPKSHFAACLERSVEISDFHDLFLGHCER